MSDETFRGPTPATPVGIGTLPSRAAGDMAQQPAPMFDVTPAKPKRVRKPATKKAAPRKPAAKKKPQALSRKEATALAKKRAASIAAKKKPARVRKPTHDRHVVGKAAPARVVGKRPELAAPYGKLVENITHAAPKNPNRPLEMKNQLQAVIAMTGVLTKSELTLFSQIVGALQNVPRNGRKRIIVGLQQVYG